MLYNEGNERKGGPLLKRTMKRALTAAALYTAAIAPRLFHRPKRMPEVYYAHRGLHDNEGDAPENTLAAFRRAVERGYGIELDVQVTGDGQVVVAHDFNLKRICGVDRDIDTLTCGELSRYPIFKSRETVPLLSDVLELVDGKVPLIVELKYKNSRSLVCELTDRLLRRYKGVYCVESFHPGALLWYRLNRPRVCRGQLSSNFPKHDRQYTPVHYAMRWLLGNFATAPDFIAYDCRDKNALSLTLCRNLFGCPAVAWTVKSRAQLEDCRDSFDYFIFEGFEP